MLTLYRPLLFKSQTFVKEGDVRALDRIEYKERWQEKEYGYSNENFQELIYMPFILKLATGWIYA